MECRTISREQCLMLNRLVEEILRTNTKALIFMTRKAYNRPTTQVVKLQHIGMLMLSGDGVVSTRSNYGEAKVEEWN